MSFYFPTQAAALPPISSQSNLSYSQSYEPDHEPDMLQHLPPFLYGILENPVNNINAVHLPPAEICDFTEYPLPDYLLTEPRNYYEQDASFNYPALSLNNTPMENMSSQDFTDYSSLFGMTPEYCQSIATMSPWSSNSLSEYAGMFPAVSTSNLSLATQPSPFESLISRSSPFENQMMRKSSPSVENELPKSRPIASNSGASPARRSNSKKRSQRTTHVILNDSSASITQGGYPRKYACTWEGCGKAFTTSGHLVRHKRIHTGEKRYQCVMEGCKSCFSRQDNMLQHYRTHLSEKSRSTASVRAPGQWKSQPNAHC